MTAVAALSEFTLMNIRIDVAAVAVFYQKDIEILRLPMETADILILDLLKIGIVVTQLTTVSGVTKLPCMHIIFLMTAGTRGSHLHFAGHRLAMAIGANQFGVFTAEREIGTGIMIKLPQPPVIRIVAVAAAWPQRAFMRIILGVTLPAIRCHRFERAGNMTLLATDGRVHPDQRKGRQIMVEPDMRVPAVFIMTRTAVPQLTAVDIFGGMAVDTFPAGQLFARVRFVAGLALRLGMTAAQGEFGIPVMIEACIHPAFDVVALIAVDSVASFMHIVGHVTIRTFGPGLLTEKQTRVTSLTGHLRVFILQRELGFSVIKCHLFPPVRPVTILAAAVDGTVVNIVNQMARDALTRGLFISVTDVT